MVVKNISDAIKGPRVKVDGPLCYGLYNKYHGWIVTWSGTDPYTNLNCFTWYKEDNDWIVLGDQYNEKCKNLQGPIHNVQFCPRTLKKRRRTDRMCSKSLGYVKLNGMYREGSTEIHIKSYRDQCCEHMIRNGMRDIFSIPEPLNKEKKWYIFSTSL